VGYHVTAGHEGVGRFAELLVDLAAALWPRLTLLDAVVAMEGEGPTSGQPRRVGALLASADPFALDWVAAEMLGVPPMDVPTVAVAARAGLGPHSVEDVKVVGEPLGLPLVRDFVMPGSWDPADRFAPLFRAAARAFSPRPRILRERCMNCNVCVDGCPTKALVAGEPTPRYVHKKCIRCYCCTEFCPYGAVEIVRPLTG
jgi:ferredoxin